MCRGKDDRLCSGSRDGQQSEFLSTLQSETSFHVTNCAYFLQKLICLLPLVTTSCHGKGQKGLAIKAE